MATLVYRASLQVCAIQVEQGIFLHLIQFFGFVIFGTMFQDFPRHLLAQLSCEAVGTRQKVKLITNCI